MYMLKHCRECFTRYKARGRPPSALFRVKQEQGNAFTILKNFQRNALIKTCSLVYCNLNGANLFIFVSIGVGTGGWGATAPQYFAIE